jgi:hypothetical protein
MLRTNRLALSLCVFSSLGLADTGLVTTVAGGGVGGSTLNGPGCVATDPTGNVFIADDGNARVLRVDGISGTITTVAGNGSVAYSGDGGAATAAGIGQPTCLALDGAGNLYITDEYNHRVRRVTAGTGIISTIAGIGNVGSTGDGGPAVNAGLHGPAGIALDAQGNVFIGEMWSNRVRKITASTGIITTYAGNGTAGFSGDGGAATAAALNLPGFMMVSGNGSLYIADALNRRIRRVTSAGIISTVAGNGSEESFGGDGIAATSSSLWPYQMAEAANGDVYVATYGRVRRIDAATGLIWTVMGGINDSAADGVPATNATLNGITAGVAVLPDGDLLVGDRSSQRVRRIALPAPGTYTALSVTAGPAVEGQPVTLTANVAAQDGSTATGNAMFFDVTSGLMSLGSAATVNGSATITATLAAGTREILVMFSGSGPYLGSSNYPDGLTLNVKAGANVAVMTSLNPSAPGQAVNFTIDVSGSQAAPTGTVQLTKDSVVVGSAVLVNGSATISYAFPAAGMFAMTVAYGGDAVYGAGVSSEDTQGVFHNTTTSVVAIPNPAVVGQNVSITASVAPAGATGAVVFYEGETYLGSVNLVAGAAVYSANSLASGSHTFTASYSGDATHNGSSGSVTFSVLTATSTALTLVNPTAPVNTPVQFNAQVSPAGATGSVRFLDGANVLFVVPVSAGAASLTVSSLAVGVHSIRAEFVGSGSYAGSTSGTLTQTITSTASSVTAVSSPSPSTYGQTVTMTATVTPAAATGTVQFRDSGVLLGTVNLVNGIAVYTTNTLTAGTHNLTAFYGGGAAHDPSSTAWAHTVTRAATTLTAVAAPSPSTYLQNVTITATLAPAPAGAAVQFYDGGALLGTVNVVNGLAALATTTLATGAHALTAVYVGDANYSNSTSAPVAHTVNKAASTSTVVSSLNPAKRGVSVTFTATVAPAGATGQVRFLNGTTVLATVTLNGSGNATYSTNSLAIGSHPITVNYLGNANHNPSTSAILTQTITKK